MQAATGPKNAGKRARIELKTSQQVKSELERAAAISGISLTAFIINQASEAARRIVEEANTVILNQKAQSKLSAAIKKPSKPTDELKELMRL
ncbi:DUF1778 domain-containing protein [Aliidiomarina quisquiliarum]|uniref:type II toxin-antitoxin system TacA family antitoxin n=1 Tax=Aliidiomarina quisquiliarum TaxID=2938947 RepID=UPI00208F9B82|nr:DUF1778 domain-containing protein [Aliidiomarina quisquiliarum]MCO4320031.1 DUF1778 domain-containing protein [Aliidiomarina quisquiliarum]